MPSIWQAIDTNFPSFSGKETPQQQIQALHDYLYQMRQGLQYSLEHLDGKKVNGTEFKKMTDAQKEEFKNLSQEQKEEVLGVLAEVKTTMSDIASTVNRVSGRIAELEKLVGSVTDLEKWTGAAEEMLQDHEERISAAEGTMQNHGEQIDVLNAISGIVKIAEDGSVTIGAEGKSIHIVGLISVNGKEWPGNEDDMMQEGETE